jgi:ectoine hydroxylase-related dioxygenase (phytanoyl-CoA dioxygenase family)
MSKTAEIQTFQECLTTLGVRDESLRAHEKQALDTQGYVVLQDVFSGGHLTGLQRAFDQAVAEQRPTTSTQKETGTRHIKDLHRSDILWRVCLQPRILAGAFHVIKRRFIGVVPHGREPLKGFGQQGLHIDWLTGGNGGVYYIATAICFLDDFTSDNGATRLVPGSHLNAERPNKKVSDPGFIHPKQISVIGTAGSVLVFNGHLLHSGDRNRGGARRRTLQFGYIAHDVRNRMATDGAYAPSEEPAVRFLFGYDENLA